MSFQKVGSVRLIKLDNNTKQILTLETVSKRRPLILQIDDFLTHEECDHIVEMARKEGLEGSRTDGECDWPN